MVDIRGITQAEEAFWEKHDRGGFIHLTKTVVIDRRRFAELKPWEKGEAKAAAVGLSSRYAVVGGLSAARLHGIDILGPDDTVELMLPGGRRPSGKSKWPKGTVFRGCVLPGHHIHTDHGIRVTTLIRTAADITRYHGELHGVVCFDSLFRKHPELSKQQVTVMLREFRKFHGLAKVKKALALSITNSGSVPESHARYLLQTLVDEVTTIEPQAEILIRQHERIYHVDLLINGWLVIEIDGRVKYDGATYGIIEDVVLSEREREKAIQNEGYVILRISPQQLRPEASSRIPFLELVRQALRTRSQSTETPEAPEVTTSPQTPATPQHQ